MGSRLWWPNRGARSVANEVDAQAVSQDRDGTTTTGLARHQGLASVPWWTAMTADFRFCRELCGGRAYKTLARYGLYPVLVYRWGPAAGRWR